MNALQSIVREHVAEDAVVFAVVHMESDVAVPTEVMTHGHIGTTLVQVYGLCQGQV